MHSQATIERPNASHNAAADDPTPSDARTGFTHLWNLAQNLARDISSLFANTAAQGRSG